MGTISENKKLWADYDWHKQGDEWSAEWGTTEILWWGTIRPRINAFVPTDTILEIAPGLGRCTQYLKSLCQHLTVVDLTERCIEACQERFSADSHITYYVNDGKSLAMIPDHSVDFVFSFDSLVHVEADVIEAYLSQLVLKLKPDGVGFLHHSNMGTYVNRSTGKLPFYFDNTNNGSNWRAESMTAERFEEYCTKVGLQCVVQEVIDFYPEFSLRWGRPGRRLQRLRQKIVDRYGRVLNDCFSVFTRKQSRWDRPNKVLANKRFMEEVRYLSALSHLYDGSSFKAQPAQDRKRLSETISFIEQPAGPVARMLSASRTAVWASSGQRSITSSVLASRGNLRSRYVSGPVSVWAGGSYARF